MAQTPSVVVEQWPNRSLLPPPVLRLSAGLRPAEGSFGVLSQGLVFWGAQHQPVPAAADTEGTVFGNWASEADAGLPAVL